MEISGPSTFNPPHNFCLIPYKTVHFQVDCSWAQPQSNYNYGSNSIGGVLRTVVHNAAPVVHIIAPVLHNTPPVVHIIAPVAHNAAFCAGAVAGQSRRGGGAMVHNATPVVHNVVPPLSTLPTISV